MGDCTAARRAESCPGGQIALLAQQIGGQQAPGDNLGVGGGVHETGKELWYIRVSSCTKKGMVPHTISQEGNLTHGRGYTALNTSVRG